MLPGISCSILKSKKSDVAHGQLEACTKVTRDLQWPGGRRCSMHRRHWTSHRPAQEPKSWFEVLGQVCRCRCRQLLGVGQVSMSYDQGKDSPPPTSYARLKGTKISAELWWHREFVAVVGCKLAATDGDGRRKFRSMSEQDLRRRARCG